MATLFLLFFFQAEDGIRDIGVTGVQTCALPIYLRARPDHPSHPKIEVVHVGTRVQLPQAFVEGEWIPGHPAVFPARQDDLKRLPLVDRRSRLPSRIHEPLLVSLPFRRVCAQFRPRFVCFREVFHPRSAVGEVLRPFADMIHDHAVEVEPELELGERRVRVDGHGIEIADELIRDVSDEAADVPPRDARRLIFCEDRTQGLEGPIRLDRLAVRSQDAGPVGNDDLGIEADEGVFREPRRTRETFEDERMRVVVPRCREERIGVEPRVEQDALHRAASMIQGRSLPKTTSAICCAMAGGSRAWNTRRPTEIPAAPARITSQRASRNASSVEPFGPPATTKGTGQLSTISRRPSGAPAKFVCTMDAPSSAAARAAWAAATGSSEDSPGSAGAWAIRKTGRPRDVARLTMRPASAIIRSSRESPNEIWTETASAPRETACSTVEARTLDPDLEPRRVPAERCTIRPQAGAISAEMARTIPGFTRSPENGADRRRRTRSLGRSIPGTGPAPTPWSRARRRIRPAPPSRRRRRLSTPRRDMSLRSPASLWMV